MDRSYPSSDPLVAVDAYGWLGVANVEYSTLTLSVCRAEGACTAVGEVKVCRVVAPAISIASEGARGESGASVQPQGRLELVFTKGSSSVSQQGMPRLVHCTDHLRRPFIHPVAGALN